VIKCRGLRWTGHIVRMEVGRSALKILTGKLIREIPLGRFQYEGLDLSGPE
jgi:hypothetical protein